MLAAVALPSAYLRWGLIVRSLWANAMIRLLVVAMVRAAPAPCRSRRLMCSTKRAPLAADAS